ncbi:AraC family transcriptional regulator [Novispirillum itersonii subsp. nipponicum]
MGCKAMSEPVARQGVRAWSPAEMPEIARTLGQRATEADASPAQAGFSRGRLLAQEVRPGLHASGFDLEYLQDADLTVTEQSSIFCGVLTDGDPSRVTIGGHGDVELCPLSPVLMVFGCDSTCTGHFRAGTRSAGAGCRISPACLDRLAGEYGIEAFRSLLGMLGAGVQVYPLPASPRLVDLAGQMLDTPYSGPLQSIHLEGCALSILAEAASLVASVQPLRPETPEGDLSLRELERVREIRQIVEDNIVSPPCLGELSRRIGINPTTMSNQFRQVFGQTIFEYVRNRRLELARTLLRSGDLPVSQVGYKVGFGNPGAFATAYRRRFGHPPSQEPTGS